MSRIDFPATYALAAMAGITAEEFDAPRIRQQGYYPKPAALGNLTAKRRAANKAARKARAKNRR